MEKYVRDKNVLAGDKERQISDYNSHDGQGIRDKEDSKAKKRDLETKEKNEELFVSDKLGREISSSSGPTTTSGSNTTTGSSGTGSGSNHIIKSEASHYNVTISSNNQMNKTHHSTTESIINSSQLRQEETRDSSQTKDSMIEYRKRLFSAHSTCSGPSDSLSERRGDILYE